MLDPNMQFHQALKEHKETYVLFDIDTVPVLKNVSLRSSTRYRFVIQKEYVDFYYSLFLQQNRYRLYHDGLLELFYRE